MLHCVTRRLACYPSYELLSPTAPSKEAVKCLTSYSLFKNAMTSSKIPKVCSNKKFKYSGSAISLSLLCAGILFGRIRYLSSQPTHGVNKILGDKFWETKKYTTFYPGCMKWCKVSLDRIWVTHVEPMKSYAGGKSHLCPERVGNGLPHMGSMKYTSLFLKQNKTISGSLVRRYHLDS